MQNVHWCLIDNKRQQLLLLQNIFKQIYSVSKATLYHIEKWFCCWKFLYCLMLNGFFNFTCITLIHLYFRELRCAFCKVIKWITISNQFESRLRLNSQTCWGGFPGWGMKILFRGKTWPFRLKYVESRPVFSPLLSWLKPPSKGYD